MSIALGWALVHFVWQGALIALALAAALSVCRTARARYGTACTAMAAMLAVFMISFAASVPDARAVAQPSAAMAAAANAGEGAAADGAPGLLERIEAVLPWLVPLWMTGVLLIGAYRLAGWAAAQHMRRRGVCAAPTQWQGRLERLADQVGLSKLPALLESSLVEAPVVIGYLRPAILMPAGMLAGLPVAQLEAILLHELAHIGRSDYVVNLLQTLVESVLFYHPAVWWVAGLMRAERENCCDDVVVAVQGDPRGYAAALVTLEEQRRREREPALAATGGILMNRIRRLLDEPKRPRAVAAPAVSLALLLGVFCLFAAAQQTAHEPASESQTTYQKWLDSDVAYIIDDAERNAFEHLATDEERDRFIEQFWQRRDPTPATSENEFKNEHYRRIVYANERYRTNRANWGTDLTRIYIIHGPPDEIEAWPGVTQLWRYNHIQGIGDQVGFEFRQASGSEELRLVSGPIPNAWATFQRPNQ